MSVALTNILYVIPSLILTIHSHFLLFRLAALLERKVRAGTRELGGLLRGRLPPQVRTRRRRLLPS